MADILNLYLSKKTENQQMVTVKKLQTVSWLIFTTNTQN